MTVAPPMREIPRLTDGGFGRQHNQRSSAESMRRDDWSRHRSASSDRTCAKAVPYRPRWMIPSSSCAELVRVSASSSTSPFLDYVVYRRFEPHRWTSACILPPRPSLSLLLGSALLWSRTLLRRWCHWRLMRKWSAISPTRQRRSECMHSNKYDISLKSMMRLASLLSLTTQTAVFDTKRRLLVVAPWNLMYWSHTLWDNDINKRNTPFNDQIDKNPIGIRSDHFWS